MRGHGAHGPFVAANWTHGQRATYVAGCHDECCRPAERRYRRDYRARKAAAAGNTVRPYRTGAR